MTLEHALQDLSALDQNQVKTDVETLAIYGQDWTSFFEPAPRAVVFPRSIEQLQAVVKWAVKHRMPLVPSGGRTGLSGGAVACEGEIVVSCEAMNHILDFNEQEQTVCVQAGVVTQQLHQWAQDQGLMYPVDLASKGSCQVGGNVATNAGGVRVLRYGHTRHWVRGLKVITGDGELLNLNRGLIKNATGYDLRHLMIGSEGTLGIIGEAILQLTRPPEVSVVALLSLKHLSNALALLTYAKTRMPLISFEFFTDTALSYVLAQRDEPRPLAQADYYVLIEAEIADDSDVLLACLDDARNQGWLEDAVISQSPKQAQSLWQFREHMTESLAHYTPFKNDIAVRTGQLDTFIAALQRWIDSNMPDWEVICFGHLGDGNVHLNILKPDSLSRETFYRKCQALMPSLYALLADFEGAISAEHGIGLMKKNHLHWSRSKREIQLMQQIKNAFDPYHLLNPGKLFPT